MKRQTNPRLEYIGERKRLFAEERHAFYSQHRGLVDGLQIDIAEQIPINIPNIRQLLLLGNKRTAAIIADFFEKFHRLKDPQPGEYMLATKECVDARSVSGTIMSYLRRTMIHERTAGTVVRHGHVFSLLDNESGVGVILSHYGCGGEGVAYSHHTGRFDGYPDLSIRGIIEAVHPAIARIEDATMRTRWNARSQALAAGAILESMGMGNAIYPTMLNWQEWPRVNVLWLGVNQFRVPDVVIRLESSAQMLWSIARELNMGPDKQYAHTIAFYDPLRLGRFNDPRVIFDVLPNEMFCVTENFDGFENGGTELSKSALGSLRYAGFLDGGHVSGVGKANGNRHIMIIDTDESVVRKVKAALLASSDDVRELTKGGQTITLAVYNLGTHLVTFID